MSQPCQPSLLYGGTDVFRCYTEFGEASSVEGIKAVSVGDLYGPGFTSVQQYALDTCFVDLSFDSLWN